MSIINIWINNTYTTSSTCVMPVETITVVLCHIVLVSDESYGKWNICHRFIVIIKLIAKLFGNNKIFAQIGNISEKKKGWRSMNYEDVLYIGMGNRLLTKWHYFDTNFTNIVLLAHRYISIVYQPYVHISIT